MYRYMRIDVDLSDDAMGIAGGDTAAYMDALEAALHELYPDTDIRFTHSGTGRIEIDGWPDGEEHAVNEVINRTWQDWLEKQDSPMGKD